MDAFPDHFAYRCLPLDIANTHAWEILSPSDFTACWNGGRAKTDVEIKIEPGSPPFASSHFGGGILTFPTGYLFRTEPDHLLWVTGPVNRPKDGLVSMSAVLESDWAPYSFTMNWAFTRPNAPVRFQRGEPFCAFFPVPRGLLEQTEPEIRDLASDPELKKRHDLWATSRKEFLHRLAIPGTKENQSKWQKNYFVGKDPDGTPGTAEHLSRLRLKGFTDYREGSH